MNRISFCAFVSAVIAAACAASARAEDVEAITRPSEDVTLSFVRPGRIARVLVKEGDTVDAGQLLVQQDDEAERVQVEQLDAQAKDDTRVKAAEAQLAQKTEDWRKLESLGKDGAVTKWDVEHAKLDVTIAELAVRLAKFENAQNQRKLREAMLQLDRMRLISPIAGKVERVIVKQGEAADALREIIRVVRIDPLHVEAPVPRALARGLKVGEEAEVVSGDRDVPARKGRITHIAAVADAASNTLTVRVEVPNPDGRPAGEHVKVRFRAPPAQDKQGGTDVRHE